MMMVMHCHTVYDGLSSNWIQDVECFEDDIMCVTICSGAFFELVNCIIMYQQLKRIDSAT